MGDGRRRWNAGRRTRKANPQGGPWLDSDDFGRSPATSATYSAPDRTFDDINDQLLTVVNLKLRDEAAKRRARRKYVRIMLNDYVMNPGPSDETDRKRSRRPITEEFGLMASFVTAGPAACPSSWPPGRASESSLPPGNAELTEIIEQYSTNRST